MAETRTSPVTFDWETEPAERTQAPASRSEARRAAPKRRRPAAKPNEPQLPPDNELWGVQAAAKFLKRSVSWVYHRAEDGTLPVRRLGGWGIRFIPGELRAWVQSGAAGGRR